MTTVDSCPEQNTSYSSDHPTQGLAEACSAVGMADPLFWGYQNTNMLIEIRYHYLKFRKHLFRV